MRDPVGMRRLFVRVHQELVGDLCRGQSGGGEMVALVAQHADQLGRQRIVQQLDHVVAPRAITGRHGALGEAVAGGVECCFVEPHGRGVRVRKAFDIAGFVLGGHWLFPG